MVKILALVSLMFIGMLYAARLSCDSCGTECENSCGTRRFRACCFNYLRRKRGPDAVQFWTSKAEDDQASRKPVLIEYLPEEAFISIPGDKLRSADISENLRGV